MSDNHDSLFVFRVGPESDSKSASLVSHVMAIAPTGASRVLNVENPPEYEHLLPPRKPDAA